MPKLRQTPEQKRRELLAAWQRFSGMDNERAGKLIGVSGVTYGRRMRDGKWEIGQLLRLVDAFHIPPADALLILTGGSRSMEKWRERNAKALRIDAPEMQ